MKMKPRFDHEGAMKPSTRIALRQTRAALAAAETAMRQMQDAESPKDFREAWENFLSRIEKIWIKAERECQPVREAFERWQGSYKHTRRKDPLLAYVWHARNADQHTIQPIAAVAIDFETLIPPGGTAVIEIDRSLGRLRVAGDVKEVSATPPEYVLLPIVDSGVRYPVPTAHLGSAMPKNDPLTVAHLALAFYKQFVADAARFEQHQV
jgi:hypothetical protein